MTARVLFVEPGKEPDVRTIDTGSTVAELQALNALIGGYLEAAYIDGSGMLALLFDEEGKLPHKRLPLNFRWAGEPIVGNVVLVRRNHSGELIDITDNDIALFREHMAR